MLILGGYRRYEVNPAFYLVKNNELCAIGRLFMRNFFMPSEHYALFPTRHNELWFYEQVLSFSHTHIIRIVGGIHHCKSQKF